MEHSLRIYYLAWELKSAGMNWKSSVLARCLSGKALEVAKLKADPTFAAEEDRAAAFVAAGHGCRATFFNYANKLLPVGDVPPITLSQSSPNSPLLPKQSFWDFLKNRYGDIGSG